MIPKTTTPLTKFIRTLEGWIVVVVNVALIAVPIITNSLSATAAVKYGTIFNAIVVASRSILKGVASFSPIFGAPITPKGIGSGGGTATTMTAEDELEQGPPADQISEGDADTGEVDPSVLTELGTPEDKVTYFGAPDEVKP